MRYDENKQTIRDLQFMKIQIKQSQFNSFIWKPREEINLKSLNVPS